MSPPEFKALFLLKMEESKIEISLNPLRQRAPPELNARLLLNFEPLILMFDYPDIQTAPPIYAEPSQNVVSVMLTLTFIIICKNAPKLDPVLSNFEAGLSQKQQESIFIFEYPTKIFLEQVDASFYSNEQSKILSDFAYIT